MRGGPEERVDRTEAVRARPRRATLTGRPPRETPTRRTLRATGSDCDPPDPAAAAGRGSCDGDQIFELVEAALADTWDLEELVDGGEGVGVHPNRADAYMSSDL